MYHSAPGSFTTYASGKGIIDSPAWDRIRARTRGSLGCMRLLSIFCMVAILAVVGRAPAQDVTTWHNDNARSGVQHAETVLTPANVNFAKFGKRFSLPVDGDVYAQPLYLHQYPMSDGQLHNLLLIATKGRLFVCLRRGWQKSSPGIPVAQVVGESWRSLA
jgi:hypothetical protein